MLCVMSSVFSHSLCELLLYLCCRTTIIGLFCIGWFAACRLLQNPPSLRMALECSHSMTRTRSCVPSALSCWHALVCQTSDAPASALTSQLGQQYAAVSASAMEQCLVEQRYVRGAQLRTLIYNQVGAVGGSCCTHHSAAVLSLTVRSQRHPLSQGSAVSVREVAQQPQATGRHTAICTACQPYPPTPVCVCVCLYERWSADGGRLFAYGGYMLCCGFLMQLP